MQSVVLRASLALALGVASVSVESPVVAGTSSVPNFSGKWRIDAEKSARLARESKGTAFNFVFGEECSIIQTDDALTLQILAGGLKVEAVYRLDGKASDNTSPGARGQAAVPVVSTTEWVNDVLHILTNSESELNGAKVAVKSIRKIWLTAEGDLAVERRGNPTAVVPDAWNVYQRAGR